MAGHRKPMIDIKRIVQLKHNGESNRRIAALLSIDRKTIGDYILRLVATGHSYGDLVRFDEAELQALLPVSNAIVKDVAYNDLLGLVHIYQDELKKPGFTYQELWFKYRSDYPDGYGSTQFKIHLQKALGVNNPASTASMHMDYVYGEKLFADYCGRRLEIVSQETGEITKVECFVAILPASGMTYVEVSESQQKSSFMRSMATAMEFFGGVPKLITTDNLKSAVTTAHTYEPVLNKDFKAFSIHYNTALVPARGYKPKDKALVEGAVKLVYQRIYYPLHGQIFLSIASLNTAIHALLIAYNERTFSQRSGSRKESFDQHERILLAPLPETRFNHLTYKKATVQKNYHVYLSADKHYYSVPHVHISEKVEVRYNDYLLEVYSKNIRICSHARKHDSPGKYSTTESHMPASHRYVKGWSKEFFMGWAKEISPILVSYFEKIFLISDHPEQAYKSCAGIQSLFRAYKKERLCNACRRAIAYDRIGYKALAGILKTSADMEPELVLEVRPIPIHDNVRGGDYYTNRLNN